MCGIFGAIGRNFDPGTFRALAIANRSRGEEAFGCFSSRSKIFKSSGDPYDVLATQSFSEFLDKSAKSCWFLCGHTRLATRGSGKVTDYAHPFQYGKYIGVHNGMVHSDMSYAVDSMYIWDELNRQNGDYQKAWEDMGGNWGLAWTDGTFCYLQSYHQTLACATHPKTGVVYFSSDPDHLKAATGIQDVSRITDGETIKFLPNGSMEMLKALEVKKWDYRGSSGYSGNSSSCYNYHHGYRSAYDLDDYESDEIIAHERMIGYWDDSLHQMVYVERSEYFRKKYEGTSAASPGTHVGRPLTDEEMNRHCTEWESYAFHDDDTTDLEIEDATGLIVVEDILDGTD